MRRSRGRAEPRRGRRVEQTGVWGKVCGAGPQGMGRSDMGWARAPLGPVVLNGGPRSAKERQMRMGRKKAGDAFGHPALPGA